MHPVEDRARPAPAGTTADPGKRRRRFGLSLRALMLVVLLLGGGLGWLAYRARVQRQAVAAIEAAGGKVIYRWLFGGGKDSSPTRSVRWKWLVDAVGPDYLGTVVAVIGDMFGEKGTDDALMARIGRLGGLEKLLISGQGAGAVTDAGMAQLRNLTRLEVLWIQDCLAVTDAGLDHLRGLTRLRDLELIQTGIDGPGLKNLAGLTRLEDLSINRALEDDSLAHLAGLTSLTSLSLSGVSLTDDGLAHLRNLTNLRSLKLGNPLDLAPPELMGLTALEPPPPPGLPDLKPPGPVREPSRITDAGVAHLGGMLRLEELSLAGAAVASLRPLAGLTRLRSLDLTATPIDDAGLAPVAGFPDLGRLTLARTRVGDAGLAHLVGLTNLTDLGLSGTRVTDAGLARLPRLSSLDLSSTAITDAGLPALLATAAPLDRLNLSGTAITDTGLGLLAARGGFKELHVSGTKATAAGLDALRIAIPGVEVLP